MQHVLTLWYTWEIPGSQPRFGAKNPPTLPTDKAVKAPWQTSLWEQMQNTVLSVLLHTQKPLALCLFGIKENKQNQEARKGQGNGELLLDPFIHSFIFFIYFLFNSDFLFSCWLVNWPLYTETCDTGTPTGWGGVRCNNQGNFQWGWFWVQNLQFIERL